MPERDFRTHCNGRPRTSRAGGLYRDLNPASVLSRSTRDGRRRTLGNPVRLCALPIQMQKGFPGCGGEFPFFLLLPCKTQAARPPGF
jgi:hypothetical protein